MRYSSASMRNLGVGSFGLLGSLDFLWCAGIRWVRFSTTVIKSSAVSIARETVIWKGGGRKRGSEEKVEK